ncbi:hypothetical protein VST63_19195 [Mycolicibacterium sp. 050232]|uniref:hypothetical protein n=1 Tax=Mycolicibacterium sp. 050232 TaxID=3113982 RepID=UPI002E294E15|nr:hypothetical protein [Mycolicibacterium sp. 050232]MED5814488.1 hypothetical protein [Mycolicibacterium sp. 050232]
MTFRDAQLDAIALARHAGGTDPDSDAVEALILPMPISQLRLTLLACSRLLYATCKDLAAQRDCSVDDLLTTMTSEAVAAAAAEAERDFDLLEWVPGEGSFGEDSRPGFVATHSPYVFHVSGPWEHFGGDWVMAFLDASGPRGDGTRFPDAESAMRAAEYRARELAENGEWPD